MYAYNLDTEVGWIKNPKLRELVEEILSHAPALFWTAPSSRSGKHHPIDEFDTGGRILHTKRVAKVAKDLARSFNLSRADTDWSIAGALVHDMGMHIADDVYYGHGSLLLNVVKEFKSQLDILNDSYIIRLAEIVQLHMGVFDTPFRVAWDDPIVLVLQLADYVASRTYIKVDVDAD